MIMYSTIVSSCFELTLAMERHLVDFVGLASCIIDSALDGVEKHLLICLSEFFDDR